MVEIKNTQVYNLRNAVVSSGNAMRLEPQEVGDDTFETSLERCKKLAKNGGGTGHTNFRTGILVSFDLKYPQYFTKQLQRYHWVQYVSSTSMMHRITKMDFSKCCNKYVSAPSIIQMNYLIHLYNSLSEDKSVFYNIRDEYVSYMEILSSYMDLEDEYNKLNIDITNRIKSIKTIEELKYDIYMSIVSNCPMGAELWVHVTTNYEQLATIYKQRKNHKLKEDWGEFCKWIESLPYVKELIICE